MTKETTQNIEKKKNRKQVKWVIIPLIIILFLVSVRVILKSDRLFDLLRDKIEQVAENRLNGTLEIDSIRGDLLSGFTLYGVQLKDDRLRDVARADSVSISYRPGMLVWQPRKVEEVSLYGFQGFFTQGADSVWNVLKLVEISSEDDQEDNPMLWTAQNIEIRDLNLDLRSDLLFPDGYLNIRDLDAEITAGMSERGYFGTVRSLEMFLEEARLPEPIEFFMSARGDDDRITLESLVINSGKTLFTSTANYTLPGKLSASVDFSPLNRDDLKAYAEELPLSQDFDIEMGLEGRLSDLQVSLKAKAPGLEELYFQGRLAVDSTPMLRELDLQIKELNTPLLTGLEGTPVVAALRMRGSGAIQINEPDRSAWTGELNITGLNEKAYQIDKFESSFEYNRGDVEFAANLSRLDQEADLQFSAQDVLSEQPVWSVDLETEDLNPADWYKDPNLEGRLNVLAALSGMGFDPDNFNVISEININDSHFGEQLFSNAGFRGRADQHSISGEFSGRLDRSRLSLQFQAEDWLQTPRYSFEAVMREFNLAELSGLERFPTHLNGTLNGNGEGIDPEFLQLRASAAFDSSFVNRERIDTLKANFKIENQFLFVDDAQLQSPIADAEFSIQQHLADFLNVGNRLNFRADLKDLRALAPLFELDRLESEGHAEGELTRHDNGHLRFDGEFDLQNTHVDSLFSSEKIEGIVRLNLFENPEAGIELEIGRPVVSGVTVQDLNFNTHLRFSENSIAGDFGLEIINEDICTLYHEGEITADSSRFHLRTTDFDFTTRVRTLSLDRPFDLEYNFDSGTARSDTMTIRDSAEDSFLSIWAPQVSKETQEAGLIARNLNLGAMQSLILDEPMIDGFVSGEVSMLNSDQELRVLADGYLTDLEYAAGRMDEINVYLNLEDEWLQGGLQGRHSGEELFEAVLQVPFLPGDPLTFDDRFFDREVEGYFELFNTELPYWFSFIPEFNADESGGAIRMRTNLTGVAGNPELDGSLHIENGLFSGIEIDMAEFDLRYTHDEEFVDLEGVVTASDHPILEMAAQLPFKVDLRQAELLLPDDDDSVTVDFKADNFNLALFDNYLDRDSFRQLRGRLNGEVTLDGRLSDLETAGEMELTDGNLHVVPAGITLRDISSLVTFNADQIELRQFSMRSGPGRMRASGSVALDNLTPGALQLSIRGNQFRAANTADYNALINLNANMEGTIEEPRLIGALTFLEGSVNLQNFGERSVEDVQLEEEEERDPNKFYEHLEMEMSVNFARQFYIQNRQYLDMEVELGGEVDLIKRRREELQMFGSLEGVQGYARPLGKYFELDEARVTFYGPVDDPELEIRTRYEPPQAQTEVIIFYIIEGTVQEPDFRFDSEPPLELQDIISYTVFGKPFYELESWEQVVAGTGDSPSAADLALDVLLDRVELLASQSLGIDVVQIDNSRSGSDSATSIKTGWYLNRRTFFAVVNEISSSRPNMLFMLEYLLNENLELIITQGDDSREGIDLRWQYDY